ncbi:MAG TPA: efflux RND transporter permease subunit, partial [Sphingomicrobium sp.]|nr:efflux RND transporter permease subunit [Sphingomicrobium sp.]
WQASIDAADEIGLAVLATTMAIVGVFLPVALMPGISGQFFKSFGYTVVVAVLMSLFVARMITPLIAAYFLKAHGVQEHASGKPMDMYLATLKWSLDTSKADAIRAQSPNVKARWFYYLIGIGLFLLLAIAFGVGAFASSQLLGPIIGMPLLVSLVALFAGAAVTYGAFKLIDLAIGLTSGGFARWHNGRQKAWLHDNRVTMVGAGLAAFALQVVLIMNLGMQFQPPLNLDFSRVSVTMAPGATLQQTQEKVAEAARVVQRDPDVEHVFERVFVGSGRLNIVLKADREKTSTDFERGLTPALSKIPDAQVSFQSQSGGGGGRDITMFLGSDNPELLFQTANKIRDEMMTLPELRAPRVQGDLARPEITIKPRFDLAADLGVTTAALSQTIRIATLGDIDQNSAKFSLADRQVPIIVALPENSRRDLSTLENLPVPTSSGGSVPLKSVAEIGFGSGPTTVQRTNQIRRTLVGADLAPGLVASDAWKKIDQLPTVKNMPQGVQRLNLGDQKWQAELIYYFLIALMSGVLLVFAVLVLLYRRFLAPLVNMGSLWLAPLGACIALLVAGQPLSLPVLIGILMLFGIVAKNSILLVDFAVEMMNHGMPKNDAIYEAGHKRAQPIVMTTVAMVAGMLPIALSLTGDGSWRAPMGMTVIGGLIFSTILTLLLVPAYYSIAIDMEQWIAARFRRLIDNGEAHSDQSGGAVPAPAE